MYGMDEGVLLDGRRYDMKRIDAYLERGVTQYWDITNVGSMTPGMIHPFHVHGAHFQVLSRNGQKPYPYESGWKDTIGVNTDETVRVAIRFDIEGLYMYHCHILEHEDTGMMAQIQILPEAQ
ncbi:multicopper oxidase domain-containing protein [Erysipelothrix sp. HDW6C]|uniref:multicopper oxidase domain-containing protein n=1 Tax=Erysipelothrix sp. HDW6C TaxID=2714930 RepID=UPI00140C8D7A|nr:multicopper oxidase domain-containing protein [Erysipelothrix sp. HDW6C]QIK68797.1 multicopper oxidase domain-containing protein [Erysipelothrix sp. HDW6C]